MMHTTARNAPSAPIAPAWRQGRLIGLIAHACVLILFLMGAPSSAPAQDESAAGQSGALPRARVVVTVPEDPDATLLGLQSTIQSTLELSLALVGLFEMVDPQDVANTESDLVFQVALTQDDEGSYIMSGLLVNTVSGERRSILQRSTDSLFEIFDVADALTVDIVSEIADFDVAFGALSVRNIGFDRPFELVIDGVSVAGSRVDRLLTGNRRIQLFEPGTDERYLDRAVEIMAHETSTVTVSLPSRPLEELRTVQRERRAQRATSIGAEVNIAAPTTEVISAPKIDDERLDAWVAARNVIAQRPGQTLAPATGSILGPVVYSTSIQMRPQLLVEREITVDGDRSDWAGMVPFRSDPSRSGDRRDWNGRVVPTDRSGTDFEEIYLAATSEGIAVLATFYDGVPLSRQGKYRFSFYSPTLGQIAQPLSELLLVIEGDSQMIPRSEFAFTGGGNYYSQRERRARYATGPDFLEGLIPWDMVDHARDAATFSGWDFGALIETRVPNGDWPAHDEIPWGRRVYF